MGRKGFVSIIEMVTVAIVLLTAFNVIFPRNVHHTNWGTAQILLNGRDMVTAIDRLGRLYPYSYTQDALNGFVRNLANSNSTIVWSETNGLIKTSLSIACNCTNDQISALNRWLYGMAINNRSLGYVVCYTGLENINPCASSSPDVLVIWQNRTINSTSSVPSTLRNYLNQGNGILEIADFTPGFNFTDDVAQRSIFGIRNCTDAGIVGCSNSPDANDSIISPPNATVISYTPYKYFYHMPLAVTSFTNATATGLSSIPMDSPPDSPCSSSIFTGAFAFNQSIYPYWICSGSDSVYFDTDNTARADKRASKGSVFALNGTNFYLKSVNISSFGIVFNSTQGYKFRDFIGSTRVYPIDNPQTKTFMSNGNYSGAFMRPVVILNGTGSSRTAWVADFSRGGLSSVGDDHRMLLISLLLWASNKHSMPNTLSNLAFGYTTSYLNVVNGDMLEVYSFSLGLGNPY